MIFLQMSEKRCVRDCSHFHIKLTVQVDDMDSSGYKRASRDLHYPINILFGTEKIKKQALSVECGFVHFRLLHSTFANEEYVV